MLFLFQSNANSFDSGSVIVNSETQKLETCGAYKETVKKNNLPTYFIKFIFTECTALEAFDDEVVARERMKDVLKVFHPTANNIDEIVDTIRFFDQDK